MGQNKPFRDKRAKIRHDAQIANGRLVQYNKYLEVVMRDKRQR